MPGYRPPPPDTLRDDMKFEWRRIVGRMPAGFFGVEQEPLLEELCRSICYCRATAAALDGFDVKSRQYHRMSALHHRCAGLVVTLSRCLRLTIQAQRWPSAKLHTVGTDVAAAEKPWEH
jgi:hypothetical protein